VNALNIQAALPEVLLAGMACLILLVSVTGGTARRGLSWGLALLALAGAAWLTLRGFGHAPQKAFHGMFVHDTLSDFLKLVICGVVAMVFVYSRRYLQDRDMFRGEYFVLGLFGVTGMMVMASAGHFLSLYLGLELLSLSLYALVAFRRDSTIASEAAMKYFVLGALASGMLLYGMAIIYGVTGSLDIGVVRARVGTQSAGNVALVFGLIMVLIAMLFKLGAVPFHMWVPDVYHGAPTSVTLYLSTAPKLAGLAILLRLLVGGLEGIATVWQDMLIIVSVLSMAGGNLIAIAQTNLKRMLAYSAISHMGFMLLGVLSGNDNGYGSALFYGVVYAVMSAGTFGMVILLSRAGFEAERLEDLKGLNRTHPWYAFLMLILMFSMAGVPPTVGFYAKLMVIQAAVSADLVWLAVIAVLLAVIGAYYYLRVIKLMYFDAPEGERRIEAPAEVRWLLSANALALLLILPWVGTLMDLCAAAIQSFRHGLGS
jgi:NADH-quinone oxidoreductase subunit N